MPDMYLRKPQFAYNACGPFTKNNKRIGKFKTQDIQDIFIKTN